MEAEPPKRDGDAISLDDKSMESHGTGNTNGTEMSEANHTPTLPTVNEAMERVQTLGANPIEKPIVYDISQGPAKKRPVDEFGFFMDSSDASEPLPPSR